jgi:hypothetical protein
MLYGNKSCNISAFFETACNLKQTFASDRVIPGGKNIAAVTIHGSCRSGAQPRMVMHCCF